MKNKRIILKETINEKDSADIKKLEKYCAERDDISFKLELEYKLNHLKPSDKVNKLNEFMCYDDDILIGYLGIGEFGGDSLELNGMVHPDYRNKGIFTKLFLLAVDEWKKRKQQELLLLNDKKSESGKKFINKVSEAYDHSEYDMVLNMDLVPSLKQKNINLRKALKKDLAEVANMDSIFFDIKVEENDEHVLENIENEATFIAEANNVDIGKVRIELIDGVGGIYGLGIMPEYRGKGYGRELLLLSVFKLVEMGADKIILQVETNNKNALNLYKSCGFRENYEMEYYKISKNRREQS